MATTELPPPSANGAQGAAISADEIALYDRQIRLWGVKAQEKIRTANILLITVKALANEIAKNLVLAGIGSLTIIDHEDVTEDDLCSQFFVSEEDLGQNRARAAAHRIRKLNPRVELNVDTDNIRIKSADYFSPYNAIIATELDISLLIQLNGFSRAAGRHFYAAAIHGVYGYIFSDLISHQFVVEREKSNVPTHVGTKESITRTIVATATGDRKGSNGKAVELVTKQEIYSPLSLAASAPLPTSLTASPRRLRQITPLLPCIRALWEYQSLSGSFPSTRAPDEVELFITFVTQQHKNLGLPPETLKADFLRNFLQNVGSELAPVAAILGGELAQDVINVLGQREQPIQNFLFFDGEETKAPIYAMVPQKPEASNN